MFALKYSSRVWFFFKFQILALEIKSAEHKDAQIHYTNNKTVLE